MNVMRSNAQPEMIHVLLTEAEAKDLGKERVKELRHKLKKVLRGK